MKKTLLFISIGLVSLIAISCAFFNIEKSSDVQAYLDVPIEVVGNTNSPYYITNSYSVGSNIAAIFVDAVSNLLYTDASLDAQSDNGLATNQYHDLTDIYFAISRNKLYIAYTTPEVPWTDGLDDRYSGGSYIYFDNGVTSGSYSYGVRIFNNDGTSDAGISGTIGNFELTDISITNDISTRKISHMLKHYRPSKAEGLKNTQHIRFYNGTVEQKNGIGSGWNMYASWGVLMFEIPLNWLIDTRNPDFPNAIYMVFRTDAALTDTPSNLGPGSESSAIDWAPEQAPSAPLRYDTDITNWIVVSNLFMLVTNE